MTTSDKSNRATKYRNKNNATRVAQTIYIRSASRRLFPITFTNNFLVRTSEVLYSYYLARELVRGGWENSSKCQKPSNVVLSVCARARGFFSRYKFSLTIGDPRLRRKKQISGITENDCYYFTRPPFTYTRYADIF